MGIIRCRHSGCNGIVHICPKCGKFQLNVSDIESAMKEFLEETDWSSRPDDSFTAVDPDELLELINLLRHGVDLPDVLTRDYYLERIKEFEEVVKGYSSMAWDANNLSLTEYSDSEEEEQEEGREYFIENDVKEARENMKEGLEKIISYLESWEKRDADRMFDP